MRLYEHELGVQHPITMVIGLLKYILPVNPPNDMKQCTFIFLIYIHGAHEFMQVLNSLSQKEKSLSHHNSYCIGFICHSRYISDFSSMLISPMTCMLSQACNTNASFQNTTFVLRIILSISSVSEAVVTPMQVYNCVLGKHYRSCLNTSIRETLGNYVEAFLYLGIMLRYGIFVFASLLYHKYTLTLKNVLCFDLE